MSSTQGKGKKRRSRPRSGTYKPKIGKNEIKTKDLEFRLGGQSNLEKFERIIEDIRHAMAKKSKSDNPEDIDYVLKNLEDPKLDDDAEEAEHEAARIKVQADLEVNMIQAQIDALDPATLARTTTSEEDPTEVGEDRSQYERERTRLMDELQEKKISADLARTRLAELVRNQQTATRKRKMNLAIDKRIVAANLYERCDTQVKEKLREKLNWSDMEFNPILLIPAIKELCTNYTESRYAYSGYLAIFKSFFELRQRPDETLVQYRDRAQSTLEQLKAVGTISIHEDLRKEPDHASDEERDTKSESRPVKEITEQEALHRLFAFIMLMGADKELYGDFQSKLLTEYRPGNRNFDMPKSVDMAYKRLSNFKMGNPEHFKKIASARREKQKKKREEQGTTFAQTPGGKMFDGCFKCGLPSKEVKGGPKPHRQFNCPLAGVVADNENAKVTNKMHYKNPEYASYFNKKKGVALLVEGKELTVEQIKETLDAGEINMDEEQLKRSAEIRKHLLGSSHAQFEGSFFQQNDSVRQKLIWRVLLDNQSTNSVFGNEALVKNIRNSSCPLELHTNGGVLTITQVADLPGYGTVWFDRRAITNILCFDDVRKKAGVIYDPKNNKFVVQKPIMNRKVVEFKMDESRHYAYSIKPKTGRGFPQTTEENELYYTTRQVNQAKRARDFLHAAGSPSVQDLKAMVMNNVIRNCPVTIADIQLAEKIYGKDIGMLKGKTTRSKPPPVRIDLVEVPRKLLKAQKDVELCIDVLWICGLPFLSTISKRIMYRTLDYIPDLTLKTYRKTIDIVLRLYNAAGFEIAIIFCDRAFRPLLEPLKDDLDIDMNYVSRDEHVPEAERNNRVVKERSRSSYHRLPYARLPKQMVIKGFEDIVLRINLVCPKGGVSQRLSPFQIIRQRNVDWDKHCKHTFGDYCQAHADGDNTMRSRTVDAIYLRPEWNNAQAGHEVLNLQTGKVISARKLTSLPVTPNIIRRVEKMAAADKMPNYKFQSKYAKEHGLFHPYTAGVDEAEDDDNESESESENSDSSQSDEERSDDESESDRSEASSESEEDYIWVNPEQRQHTSYTERLPLVTDQECDDENESDEDDESSMGRPTRRAERRRGEEDSGNEAAGPPGDTSLDDMDPEEEQDQSDDERVEPLPHDTNEHSKEEEDNEQASMTMEPAVPQRRWNRNEGGRLIRQYPDSPPQGREGSRGHSLFQNVRVKESEINFKVTREELPVLMMVIDHLNHCYSNEVVGTSLLQSKNHSIKRALKKWGEEARQAALNEMRQLHDRLCIRPVKKSELTAKELREAMESFSFLIEKAQKQKVKSRHVADGSTQRPYVDKHDTASPTVSTDALFITATIDAQERRDVATLDIPNAFVQTKVPPREDGTRIIMRVTGDEASILMDLDPMYRECVVYEPKRRGKGVEPVIYCHVTRAIYGMLQSALWFYKQWKADLLGAGFSLNPYDPCTANKMVDGNQLTVVWHVDDVKVSHVDPEVVGEFCEWTNKLYGDKKIGEVKPVRGTRHEYLGMYLDFGTPGKVVIDMTHYMAAMVEDYPYKLLSSAKSPANAKLFEAKKCRQLDEKEARVFHTFVAKALYACKRARPDLMPTVAYLCTRVKEPNVYDQQKLTRMMTYVRDHLEDNLTLEGGNVIVAGADAAFAVHDDMKSHTGVTITLGKGSFHNDSRKQKLVTKSSCEAEIVAADTGVTHLLWTKWFCEAQGYKVESIPTLLQDNESAIKLETNGKLSSSQRTRHINIRYFFITDNVERQNVRVQYCPTDQLTADFHSKPLQGYKFLMFKAEILNLDKLREQLKSENLRRSETRGPFLTIKEMTRSA